MNRGTEAARRNDRHHWRPRVEGLAGLLTAWPAWLGLMLPGCSAAQGYGHLVLTDPFLGGMQAAVVAIPASWKAHGSLGRATCGMLAGQPGGIPVELLSEESPDGQVQYRLLPALGWQWTHNNTPWGRNLRPHPTAGCLPIFAPVSAAQFLRLYAQHMPGVHIVGPSPVPPHLQAAVAKAAAEQRHNPPQYRMQGPLSGTSTLDAAALQVESGANGRRRDGLLTAIVTCKTTQFHLPSGYSQSSGNCLARMSYLVTPPGRFAEMSRVVAALPPIKWNRHWQVVHRRMLTREGNRVLEATQREGTERLRRAYRQDQARSIASHRAFMQQQATQQRNHEAFLGQMQSATRSSMNNANAAMNARSTAASDWQDYSLNQQTVRGANGTYKTSSQYTNVWSSPNGPSPSHRRTFGSTDNNANPNSATDNTWTKDKKVHGNGKPR